MSMELLWGLDEIMYVKCLAYSQCLIQADPFPPVQQPTLVPPGITNQASAVSPRFDYWPFDLFLEVAATVC